MITIQKFHLYSLKVSAHVKISVEYFENFGGQMPQMPEMPPGCAPGQSRCHGGFGGLSPPKQSSKPPQIET